MRPEQYQKVYSWFKARPKALQVLRLATKGLPVLVALSYGFLLMMQWGLASFWRAVWVPALLLCIGSGLRRWYDAPRPYEKGIVPLIPKDTKGQSCPSRHALSAGVIGAVWLVLYPAEGIWVLFLGFGVCITRVLAGVHSIWDVTAGFLFGFGCGVAGMIL